MKLGVMTPLGAKSRDIVSIFCTAIWLAAIIGVICAATSQALYSWEFWGVLIALAISAYPVNWLYWHIFFERDIYLEFTPESFHFCSFIRTHKFDLSVPHRFLLIPDHKAAKEKESHMLKVKKAQLKRKVSNPKKYYGDAWILVFEYMDHQYEIIPIYQAKNAKQALSRCVSVNAWILSLSKTGGGRALSPEDEWSLQAGGYERQQEG